MSQLGKIFVFEQNPHSLNTAIEKLERHGFLTFGTDNIYQLLSYSKEINPDVVIMNLPNNFDDNEETWFEIEKSLCQQSCPQIYINAQRNFDNLPTFHYYNFSSDMVTQEQINEILNNMVEQKYLH